MEETEDRVMAENKAELYRNPNAKFVRDGALDDILQQFRNLGAAQKPNFFIKYDGKTYLAHEVDGLKAD
jgi:hypothetical protein